MKSLWVFYDKNRPKLDSVVDFIYQTALILMVMLSAGKETYVDTYAYNLSAAAFLAFGLWSYHLKGYSARKAWASSFKKLGIVLAAGFFYLIATKEVRFSGLETALCTLALALLYWSVHRKGKWPTGEISSSFEYLKSNFGRTAAAVPEIIMFLGVMIPAIIGAPKIYMAISLLIPFLFDLIFVAWWMKNKQMTSPHETTSAASLPNGRKIYRAIKHCKAMNTMKKIEHVRRKLREFYSSEDAQKVPPKEVFKRHSALRFGVRQDNEDKRNLFLALFVGYALIKFADILVKLLSDQTVVELAANTDGFWQKELVLVFGMVIPFAVIMILVTLLAVIIVVNLERFNQDAYINYILPYETSLVEKLREEQHQFVVSASSKH